MIWEEMHTKEPLSLTLTRAFLLAIGEAFTTTMLLAFRQVSVATTMAMPTPTVRSVSLCFVVLNAKSAEQEIATEIVRKLET